MKTVANLKDSVSGLLQGTNLNNVTNLDGALERSARDLVQRIHPPEAILRKALQLYWGVTDYPAPTDTFDSAFIDLRPQGNARNARDYVYKNPPEQFDRTRSESPSGYKVAFEFDKGVPIVRISQNRSVQGIVLDLMTATTGWTAGGSLSGLAVDTSMFFEDTAALRFTLTGNSVGTLTKTISAIDLTAYRGVGVGFLALRTPNATNLTQLELRLGSDASNYYSVTATQGFLGAWTTNEYLLVAFDLAQATTVGSPVITAMDYVQLLLTHTATISNIYAGQLFLSLPYPHELLYESAAIFLASGALSASITTDNDQIVLSDAAYVIYEHICAITIATQMGGSIASGLVQGLSQTLNGVRGYRGILIQPGLLDLYRADNPSQVLRVVGNYYND